MTPVLSGGTAWWCSPCMRGEGVAKKEKSPADLFREELERRKTEGRPRRDGPVYVFPESKVKQAREKAKLKIAWVAEKLGLEPAAVSDAEKGKNVRLHVAVALAEFYGWDVAELFGKATVKPPEPVQPATEPKVGDMYEDAKGEIHDEVPSGMKL